MKRGIARTFQINTLFAGLTVLENLYLAVSERHGHGGRDVPTLPASAPRRGRGGCSPHRDVETWRRCGERRLPNCPTAANGWSRSPSRWLSSPRCSCWTSPRPACPRRKATSCSTPSTGFRRTSPSLSSSTTWTWSSASRTSITVLVNGAVLTTGAPEEIAANTEVRAVYLGEQTHG